MKLAASGKGGVGKTTVIAALARLLVDRGHSVFAIDADPAANLAQALGERGGRPITPLSKMRELIAERTGADLDRYSQFFKLNPSVEDIPDSFSQEIDGVKLLVLGAVHKPGGGCYCPENTFLKALLANLVLRRNEAVLIDLEAGLEHLGRATAAGIDTMLVVVEPSLRSVATALEIGHLAREMGVGSVLAVANKVASRQQEARIRAELERPGEGGIPLAATIPYYEKLLEADLSGEAVYRACPELLADIAGLLEVASGDRAGSHQRPAGA